MRILPVVACAMLLSGAAEAQVAYSAPRGGDLGGGLIEFMMTGRDGRGAPPPMAGAAMPTPYGRPVQAQPRMPIEPDGFVDPFAEPRPMRGPAGRYAALPTGREAFETVRRGPDPRYARQVVPFEGPEAPGTLVVDTPSKFLYLVQPGGKALRYGIGVGRPGFTWAGVKTITRKAEWPSWTPPAEMLRRRPDLPRFMQGGVDNPLGARALYLGSTLYRIHGTNEPDTIGQNVSSGCIRMLNDDVVDLYGRVPVGAKVKVI